MMDVGFILINRFVMTKIHSLSFGSKLDGAVDAAISARLQALQFLTPHDLNVSEYARNDAVLALAQVRQEIVKLVCVLECIVSCIRVVAYRSSEFCV